MNLYKDVPKDKAGLVTNTPDSKRVQTQDRFEQAKGVADTLVSAVSATAKAVGNYARQFAEPDAWVEPPKVAEKDKYAVFDKIPHQDMLALEFPNFKDNINKARAAGFSDEEITAHITEWQTEQLARKGATIESVDKKMGRTAQSKRQLDWWSDIQEVAGMSAVTGLEPEEAEKRLAVARHTGLSPSLLLLNDKFYTALKNNANFKEKEGVWQTVSEAVKRSSLREERADLYIAQLNGETPKDKLSESYNSAQMKYFEENGMLKQPKDNLSRIKEIDKELAELAPSPFEGGFQRAVGQAVENTADWIDWQDIALMAASGGLGALGTVGSGLSKAQKAAKAWKFAKNAYKISMVERTFKREFAEKHEELTGYGIERERAVNVAAMYAAMSTWAEYGQLEALGSLAKAGTQAGPVAKLFGLGKRDFSRLATESPVMQQALEKTTMDCAEAVAKRTTPAAVSSTADAMLNFTPKQVVAQGVRNVVSGLVEEGLEEVVQQFYSNLANEVAAYAQGNTKYQHMTAGEILLDSVNAGVEALPSLALMVGGGGAIGMARGSYAAHNFQKDNAAVIARLKYEEKAGAKTLDSASSRRETENSKTLDFRAGVALAERQNFAYVDKAKMDAAIEQIAAVSPEAAENFANSLMLSPETTIETEGSSEYVIDKNSYDELLQTLPQEQARQLNDAVSMNIREGAMGVTGEEIAKFYEAKTHDPFENKEDAEAQEAISIRAQLINDLEAAGQSSEISQTVADIYSRYLYVASKQFGTTVDELHNLSVQKAGGYDASNPEEYLGKTRLNQGSKFEYERRLADDTQAWGKIVDAFTKPFDRENNPQPKADKAFRIMKTPLVLTLAGAKHLDLTITARNINKVLKKKHNISPEIIKQLPTALCEPLAVFNDKTEQDVLIALLELKHNNAAIVVPVKLDQRNGSVDIVNEAKSIYSKDHEINGDTTGTNWIIEQLQDKPRVAYIDRKKSSDWARQLGHQSSLEATAALNSLPDNIPNEQDLVNARAERNNKFYQDLLHASKADGIIRFDHGFMGTGEGQQIYGWGTYGAMAQSVVDWYLEQFSGQGYEIYRNGEKADFSNGIEGLEMRIADIIDDAVAMNANFSDKDYKSGDDFTSAVINSLEINEALARGNGAGQSAEEYRQAADWLKEHKAEFSIKEKTAHLYKFRVPDVIKGENYLDWDNAVSRSQLERIGKALEEKGYIKDANTFVEGNLNVKLTGKSLYKTVLCGLLGSDKAASQFLDNIGIVGNIYLDGLSRNKGEGTYNFVIFNEDNAQIIEQLFQETDGGEKRGSVEINRTTGSKLVELFAAADSSTFVHEMGHVILEDLMRYGSLENATDEAKTNLNTALEYLGISDLDISDLDHLSAEDSARLRAAHEKWAEAFGKYIAEGIAPSTGMRAVFKQVRRWLIDLFTEAQRSGVELSPEVRGIFDSLLATPQEMDEFYEANTTIEEIIKETEAMNSRAAGLKGNMSLREDAEFDTTGEYASGVSESVNAKINERIKHVNEINRELDTLEEQIAIMEEERALTEEIENAPGSRKSLLKWLADNGKKISLSQAQADFAEDALLLKKDIGGKFFSESGAGLDELAQDLSNAGVEISSGDELISALMTHDLETAEQKKAANAKIKELKAQAKELKNELAKEERELKRLNPQPSKHKTATEALFERLHTNRVRIEDMAKVVREINKCVTDKEVIWSMQEQILQTVLNATKVVYRKSRRKPFESVFGTKRLERAAGLYEQIKAETGQSFAELADQDPQSAGYVDFLMRLEEKGYDIQDLKLSQLKLAELTALAEEVTRLRTIGKAEYKIWKARREMRVSKAFQALEMNLRKQGMNERKTVLRTASDLGKDYSGIRGKLEHFKDWGYAATLGANRFFDWLGGGRGKYDTVFTRVFVDSVNDATNEKLRWTHARREAMEAHRKELGIKMQELGASVIVGSEEYTVDELMSIYAGMKNDKSAAAIKYGTFAALGEGADAHIAQCIAALEPKYKALADFVIDEYEQHFARLNNRFIKSFNKGMQHEPNYTPMRRLEYSTAEGTIDALDKAFMQGESFNQYGASVSLEQNAGFMKSRLIPAQELAAQYQTGIELGLMSVWNSQVEAQEHTAAFADTAPFLAQIMTRTVETPYGVRISLKKIIADNFGKNAWRTLTDYVKLITLDDVTVASSCLNGFANFAGRNMAVTYLAANIGTMLKQFTSIPRFMLSASPARVVCAMADAARNWKGFSEEIYEMDPQMRDRVPNAWLKLANDREAGGRIGQLNEGAKNCMEALMQHISFCDRFVACVGWRATYDACMARGMSREDAVREAARSVVLTQQTQQLKDAPRIWQQKGVLGLAMIFTSDCAQSLGLGVYDMVQSFRRGDVPAGCRVFAGLLASACLYKAACDGLPDGDDDESWLAWLTEALAQQSLESMPLVGKDIYASIDRIYHKGWHPQSQSPFIAPFGKILDGVQKTAAEDSWREGKDGMTKFERGLFDIAEGCSLLGLPVPAVAGRRAYKALNYITNDEYANALMTIAGMRVKK